MNAAIAQDTVLLDVLGALPEKFVVDFANGINVSRDHIATQRQRTGMFDRLYDGFTGKGQRRQIEINASLADGVAGSLSWLTELTGSLAKSNLAISKVKQRVIMLQGALTEVAIHAGDTRNQLRSLEQQLTQRVDGFAEELARIDTVQRAGVHLDLVLSKWQAGVFASLSLAGRCYAALEELRWGAFGDFCHGTETAQRAIHLELLRNRVLGQLAADARIMGSTRIDTADWLVAVENARSGDLREGLAYLGDWATMERTPFVFAAANVPADLPMLLPRRCSAERLANALVAEVFEGAEA